MLVVDRPGLPPDVEHEPVTIVPRLLLVMKVRHRKVLAKDLVHASSAEHMVGGDPGPVHGEQLSGFLEPRGEIGCDIDELVPR